MAVNANIYRIRNGNETLLASNVSTPYDASGDDIQDGDTIVVEKADGSQRFTYTVAPTINSFTATNPSGQDVKVTIESDEAFGGADSDIEVAISQQETATLTGNDFTETSTNPFVYEATYAGSSDGTYEATLNTFQDADGNDGAGGESDTVTIDTTPPTAISDLSATDDEYQQSTVTGTYPSESDFTTARLYRGTSSGFTRDSNSLLTTISSPTAGNSFTFEDDGRYNLSAPTNGTTHYYVMETEDDAANVSASNEASGTPTAPTEALFIGTDDVVRTNKNPETEIWSTTTSDTTGFGINASATDGVFIKSFSDIYNLQVGDGTLNYEKYQGDQTFEVKLISGFLYVGTDNEIRKNDVSDGTALKTFNSLNKNTFDGHGVDALYSRNGSGELIKVDDTDSVLWTWTPPTGTIRGGEGSSDFIIADQVNGGVWVQTYDSGNDTHQVYKVDSTGSQVGSVYQPSQEPIAAESYNGSIYVALKEYQFRDTGIVKLDNSNSVVNGPTALGIWMSDGYGGGSKKQNSDPIAISSNFVWVSAGDTGNVKRLDKSLNGDGQFTRDKAISIDAYTI